MADTEDKSAVPSEEFIRAFTTSQRTLFLYLLPFVGNSTDAEEILQETNVVVWSKWQQFELGTNFLAWARTIARLEVFRFRRSRHHRLSFLDDDILELVVKRNEEISESVLQKQDALEECLAKLKPKDQELIRLRYSLGVNGDDVAKKLGRPPNSVYQSLGRIRKTLMECVRIRMIEQGGTS